MTKRTSSAKWVESKGYWMIKVQHDGMRKSFYSTKPGRNGQREANAKADKWLETGVQDGSVRCKQALEEFLELKQNIVGTSQYSQLETLSVRAPVRPPMIETRKRRWLLALRVFDFCKILKIPHFLPHFFILHLF